MHDKILNTHWTSKSLWKKMIVEPKAMEIKSERPKVGLWVCIVKDNKVLFGKRKNAHGEGTRCRPWWHLEFWETREECAKRETLEEAGIELEDISLMHVTNDVFKQESKHYVTLLMKASYKSWIVQVMEPEKCESWERFDRNNLPKNIFLPIQNMINQWINPL